MPEQAKAHLDAAYYDSPTRELLEEFGFDGEISRKGVPAPIQVGQRWVVERTNSWVNGYGKLCRCTERDGTIVDFYLYLAAALLTVRRLIQRARTLYRWDTPPTHRPMAEVIPIAERSKPCRHWERGRVSPRRQRVRRWSVA